MTRLRSTWPATAVLLTCAWNAQVTLAATCSAPTDSRDATDLQRFEHRVALSKELGATQMVVTDELPLATWEYDGNDPYPAWFVHHATLFKIHPPMEVQKFVDMPYALRVCPQLETFNLTHTIDTMNAHWRDYDRLFTVPNP